MAKRLYRSRKNRVIAGVAAGIADYFGIDPVIVRLLFVVLAVGQGSGILAYVIGWIVIPEEPETTNKKDEKDGEPPTQTKNLAMKTPTTEEDKSGITEIEYR